MSLVPKRSSRQRKTNMPYTPSKATETVANFNLDTNKALNKKIDAANSPTNIEIDLKKGNLVVELSAAAFEAFRLCAKSLDTNFKQLNLDIEMHNKKSNNGLRVSESVSVRKKQQKMQLYRINLYLTTCTVNVNGRGLATFIDQHLPTILEHMFFPALPEVPDTRNAHVLVFLST